MNEGTVYFLPSHSSFTHFIPFGRGVAEEGGNGVGLSTLFPRDGHHFRERPTASGSLMITECEPKVSMW